MKLEDIGFYTLTDDRAKNISIKSPIQRMEIILTDRCNLKCPYCRGLKPELQGDIDLQDSLRIVNYGFKNRLNNIRFSGGEPTLHKYLKALVFLCKAYKVARIAISTNGTALISDYQELIDLGVNDFSISLDASCCAIGEIMVGGNKEAWEKASEAIKYLSNKTYVTVGVVFNELNYKTAIETILYIDSLRPSDIRIISSAQYNQALLSLADLPKNIINKYPILKYRINNINKRNVRGLISADSPYCYLVMDDLAVAGNYHFPCIIYLREGGDPIGRMHKNFRKDRFKWFINHSSFEDKICRNNCLDVCIEFNNRVRGFKGE